MHEQCKIYLTFILSDEGQDPDLAAEIEGMLAIHKFYNN